MLNLDTHILIHALSGDLKPHEDEVLRKNRWGISAIVLWEIAKLHDLGRITLDLEDVEFAQLLSRVHVWPLDLQICRQIRSLDFRGDPADEIIAATSVAHNARLITRDRKIRASKVVPLA
jgi:PIN domain nuclease of toxin-antitoxin system